MPTNTYTPLATVTLTGSDSEIVFASIPTGYRDLILIVGNMTSTAANTFYLQTNGDTASNYSWVAAWGTGSGTGSASGTGTGILIGGYTGLSTSTGQTTLVQLMDYSSSDKHKTVLARHNNSASEVLMSSGRWANTGAITSISLKVLPSGSFQTGSTFSLYGVIA
jgi:hypothetical protein